MKQLFYTLIGIIVIPLNVLMAQNDNDFRLPLIGERAPAFEAHTTKGDIKFPDDFYGKWKILFSHPADFTPVCTSEMIELAKVQEDFKDLNTALIVISVDGLNSHIEWVKSIESLEYKGEKSTKIEFPLVSDVSLEVSKKYGMLHPYSSSSKDIRGVFIIDPDNKVRALFYYPMSTGRNIEEIKRTLIALQLSDKENVFTPANWQLTDEVLLPSPKSIEDAEKLRAKNNSDITEVAWYMWFKKL